MEMASDDAADGTGTDQPDYLRTPEATERREAAKAESRAVSTYLDFIRRKAEIGKQSEDSLARREDRIKSQLEQAGVSAMERLLLMQQQKDLKRQREWLKSAVKNQPRWEDGFIEHAAAFSKRKGIEYDTWIEFGVSKAMLVKARIKP